MAGGRLGSEGHSTSSSTGCPVPCLRLSLPLNSFGAPANGAVDGHCSPLCVLGWSNPQVPFPRLSRQLRACVSNSSIAFSQLDIGILSTQPKRKDKE